MPKRIDRAAAARPVMATAHRVAGPASSDREERLIDTALELFQEAIRREVDDRLDGEGVLEARLERVLRASRQAGGAQLPRTDDELVSYGYTTVKLWLRMVLADGRCAIGLAERSLDDIAKETVARALNRPPMPASPDGKVALLIQCAAQLPAAYVGWRLGSGVLDDKDVEESLAVGKSLVSGLRHCFGDAERAVSLLRKWASGDGDLDEVIGSTRRALWVEPS